MYVFPIQTPCMPRVNKLIIKQPNEVPQPTIKDTALFRLPGYMYARTVGRVLGQQASGSEEDSAEEFADDDDNSETGAQRTPSTDSADDFELLEKSVDSLPKAKTTSSQARSSSKAKKRSKKR